MKVFSAQVMRLLRGVILLAVLAAVQPFVWRTVASSAATLQDKRTIKQQTIALRERLAVIDAAFTEQTASLEDLAEIFPPVSSTSAAVERLEELADNRDIALTIQNIQEEKPLGPLNRSVVVPLTISVKATGAVDRLLEYIDAVEHVPEVTAIDEWVLNSTIDNTSADNWPHRLTLNVVWYFQPAAVASQ